MDLFSPLPAEAYGPLTPALERILGWCRSAPWLRAPPTLLDASVRARLEALVRQADAAASQPGRSPLLLARSGREHLVRLLDEVRFEPERADEPWRAEPIARLVAQLNAVRGEPWFQRRVVAPLWVVPGMDDISQPIAATPEALTALTPDADFQETLWPLLCRIELDVWNALRWVVADLPPEDNPFEALVRVYATGFFPLGRSGGSFVFWSAEAR